MQVDAPITVPTADIGALVFRKTQKGHAEFDSSARALPPKLRTVLVLVDGKRSVRDLRTMLPLATPQALADLRTLGLIEVVQPASPRPLKDAGSSGHDSRMESRQDSRLDSRHQDSRHAEPSRSDSRFASSQAPSRFDVAGSPEDEAATDHQREQIERSLKRALGPAADGLTHSIREARTVRDLLDVLSTAQRAIANARGQDMADEFASRYGNIDQI